MSRAPLSALLAIAATLTPLASPAAAAATTLQVSLPAIERQVMCVTCKIPLDEAQAPQAARERAFIGELIAQGRSEAQIKSALVAQYGAAVLALPRARGFDAAAYVVPLAVVVALAALLAFLLPSWRRRARAPDSASGDAPGQAPELSAADAPGQAPKLSAADAARLDADMARFD
jgi:cytochrome c-type biogenesis protein CcmH